jgi:hypothetical protein
MICRICKLSETANQQVIKIKATPSRSDYFWFGLVFIKKNNQIKFFFFKSETGLNRPVSVRFGFLGQKPVQTGLARFFRFGLVFLVWLSFFSSFFLFRFGSVFCL